MRLDTIDRPTGELSIWGSNLESNYKIQVDPGIHLPDSHY